MSGGGVRQSNRTDNASAKMATSTGVLQGDTGVAAVDDRTQIIVVAQAYGTGSEHDLLLPAVDARARDEAHDPDDVRAARLYVRCGRTHVRVSGGERALSQGRVTHRERRCLRAISRHGA